MEVCKLSHRKHFPLPIKLIEWFRTHGRSPEATQVILANECVLKIISVLATSFLLLAEYLLSCRRFVSERKPVNLINFTIFLLHTFRDLIGLIFAPAGGAFEVDRGISALRKLSQTILVQLNVLLITFVEILHTSATLSHKKLFKQSSLVCRRSKVVDCLISKRWTAPFCKVGRWN